LRNDTRDNNEIIYNISGLLEYLEEHLKTKYKRIYNDNKILEESFVSSEVFENSILKYFKIKTHSKN
jgi:hypothetical protein